MITTYGYYKVQEEYIQFHNRGRTDCNPKVLLGKSACRKYFVYSINVELVQLPQIDNSATISWQYIETSFDNKQKWFTFLK